MPGNRGAGGTSAPTLLRCGLCAGGCPPRGTGPAAMAKAGRARRGCPRAPPRSDRRPAPPACSPAAASRSVAGGRAGVRASASRQAPLTTRETDVCGDLPGASRGAWPHPGNVGDERTGLSWDAGGGGSEMGEDSEKGWAADTGEDSGRGGSPERRRGGRWPRWGTPPPYLLGAAVVSLGGCGVWVRDRTARGECPCSCDPVPDP